MKKVLTHLRNREYFLSVARTLKKIDLTTLEKIITRLEQAKEEKAIVFLLGNGGSAATASHAANDLLKMGKVRAICLSDMTPTTLAYGNDNGWENMFIHPLIGMVSEKDVIIGVSCSGNSPNVVKVADFALKKYDFVALTGDKGGKLAKIADLCLKVPHNDIRVQEDVHLAIFHAIAGALNA